MNRWILVVFVAAIAAGCGIEWFPDDNGTNTRNNVSFGGVTNPCGQIPGLPVTSQSIQVFGLVTSASISVFGASGTFSKYSLNGGEFTDTPTTIAKGVSPVNVRLQHLAATDIATNKIVITTLNVDGKNYFFKSSTNACPTGTNGIE